MHGFGDCRTCYALGFSKRREVIVVWKIGIELKKKEIRTEVRTNAYLLENKS